MALTLSLSSLPSRITRTAVSSSGVRRFAASALTEEREEGGNIVQKLWSGFTRFGGFLVSRVVSLLSTVVAFSFTLLWGLIVSTVQFVWNFNWNASDAELDQTIQNGINSLASSLGGTLGNALGFLACGALPGMIIFAFNEPLGLHVLKNVGEEALEEIAGNVANLIRQVGNLAIKASIIFLYKNARRFWREPDSKIRKKLESENKLTPDAINKAIAERNKPWSFAKTFEDAVDSIPNEFLKNFVEELFEEFTDSCVEAGYVVANSVDSYLASQRLADEAINGRETTVEITLNRDNDSAATTP